MRTPADQSTKPASSLEKIITSRPVDGTAARVIAQGPKGYESGKKIAQVLSATPLPLRQIPRGCQDITGSSRGKLTVVGLMALDPDAPPRKEAALWVCRCVCGNYVTRLARSIKNERNQQDACDRCRHVTYLRRRSYFDQTGQNKPITEFL